MHLIKYSVLSALLSLFGLSCSSSDNNSENGPNPPLENSFYYGADLSYVNEMKDCGATYKDANNITKDPYVIFKEAGCNLVRVRIWHNPTWTNYSNFNDVKTTIQKAKQQGMKVLLDFLYLLYIGHKSQNQELILNLLCLVLMME